MNTRKLIAPLPMNMTRRKELVRLLKVLGCDFRSSDKFLKILYRLSGKNDPVDVGKEPCGAKQIKYDVKGRVSKE